MALSTRTLPQLRTLARQFSNQELGTVDEADAFVTDAELLSLLNFGIREMHSLFVHNHGHEYFLAAYEIEVTADQNIWELPDDLVTVKGVDFSSTTFGIFGKPPLTPGGDDPDVFYPEYDVPLNEKEDSVPLLPYTFHDRHDQSGGPWQDQRTGQWCPAKFRTFISRTGGQGADGEKNMIRFTPAITGYVLVWYLPEVPQLVGDSDYINGFQGFEEYPAVYAALQMAAKQEDDTSALQARLAMLKDTISKMASTRNIGQPEIVTDVGGM